MQWEYYSQHDAEVGKISKYFPFMNVVLGVFMSGVSFLSLKKIRPIFSVFLISDIVGSLITEVATTFSLTEKSTRHSVSFFSSPTVGEAK